MPDAIDLDHVAVAAERFEDLWPRYIGELGGRWLASGPSPGFDWAQVAYANGMRVEMLQPARVEEFDFLRRFLDRLGPGPHHITFKVPDLDDVLGRLAAAGIEPARVDRSHPDWQEAFLFPADAWGIVVQLAQASVGDPDELGVAHPEPSRAPAWLDHLSLTVTDVAGARRLYEQLLGGQVVGEGTGTEGPWVELAWPGPGRVRLVEATGAAVGWLQGKPGRLHHLAFTIEDPAGVNGAVLVGEDGTYEVAPEANLGTRLRLRPPATG